MEKRIAKYQADRKLTLGPCLGVGTQGSVFVFHDPSHSRDAAVKFHDRQTAYERELGVYLRLRDLDITHVCGHRVPLLFDFDHDLLAIAMTIVSPPFVVDFGGAYLDQPPDYTPEVWEDWREQKSQDFEDHWPAVEDILAKFRTYGIYIADINPGNIRF